MNKTLLGVGITLLSGLVLRIAYDMGQCAAIHKIYERGWTVVSPDEDETKETPSKNKES